MAKEANKQANKKQLETETIKAQTQGVRKPLFESVLTYLTPAKLASIIKQAKEGDADSYLTLAEEMEERDAQYRTVLNTRKLQVIATPYSIKVQNSEDKKQLQLQEFVVKLTNNPAFKKALFQLLDGLGKGYSVLELVYEQDNKDKLYYPVEYIFKPQQWFVFKDNKLYLKETDQESKELPELITVKHIPTLKSGAFIRGGLAYCASSIFILKNYGVKDWGAMVEVFGMPLRVGKFGAEATEEDKTALLHAVADIGVDYSAIISDSMQIEFVNGNSNNSNGELYTNYINYLDEQLSKIVLGQTMTTDSGSSYSQAQVHNQTREIIRKADCIDLADTINNELIKPLINYNFGEQEYYPYLEFDFKEQEDKKDLVSVYKQAYELGLPLSKSQIRQELALNEPIDNDDALEFKGQNTQETEQDVTNYENSTNIVLNAENSQANNQEQDEIDQEVEKELEQDAEKTIEPIINDIEKVLNSSSSIDEAIKKLEEQEELNTQELQKSLFKSSLKEFTKFFSLGKKEK